MKEQQFVKTSLKPDELLTSHMTFGKRKQRWRIIEIFREIETTAYIFKVTTTLVLDRNQEPEDDGSMVVRFDFSKDKIRRINGVLRIKCGKRVVRIHPCERPRFEEFSFVE